MKTVVENFFEKVNGNDKLQKEYESLDTRVKVLEFAKALGFNFTETEFVKHLDSDIDLENISGGTSNEYIQKSASKI